MGSARRSLVAALAVLAGLASEAGAGPSCTCRANGHDYNQGELACIRGMLARCAMHVNNSSWKIVADVCPEVELAPAQDRHFSLLVRPRNAPPAQAR
jgi:hypothetical protein